MGMVLDRIGLLLRRGLAWWIDAFMAAAVIVVARWAINALADAPLTGQALEVYNAVALALVFYVYRVWAEATKATSLGKWSLKLEIIVTHPGVRAASLRNSWLLLSMLTLTGLPIVMPLLLGALSLCVLAFGQTPFDMLANCLVERRPQMDTPSLRGQR
ncbi:RDD family protein [Corynebacterium tuberculostearicum]|nr:RDD family protein [Corynebacterium tuberculostearicum]